MAAPAHATRLKFAHPASVAKRTPQTKFGLPQAKFGLSLKSFFVIFLLGVIYTLFRDSSPFVITKPDSSSDKNSDQDYLEGLLTFGEDGLKNTSSAQPVTKVSDAMVCNAVQETTQGKWFAEYLGLGHWVSVSCAEPFPFGQLIALNRSLEGHPPTLLSIGTNKGFDVVRWMDFFAPGTNINARSWSHYLQNRYMTTFYDLNLCGSCGACNLEPFTVHDIDFRDDPFLFLLPFTQGYDLPSIDRLRILGIEASLPDYSLLEKLKRWSKHQSLEVHNIAVTDGINQYPVDLTLPPPFVDMLHPLSTWNQPTKYLTVDQILSTMAVPHAHILKINVGGNEPLIIQGASRSLRDGKFSLIEFKYLDSYAWRESKLQGIVNFLSSFGYDCYMSTYIATYVRLTNCFHPNFEFFRESNILCASRKNLVLNEYFLSKCSYIE